MTRILVESGDPAAALELAGTLGVVVRHHRRAGRPVPAWLDGTTVEAAGPAAAEGGPQRPPLGPARLLDYTEAGQLLGVSARTVRRLVAQGRLPARRVGARSLVRRRDVEEFADRDD